MEKDGKRARHTLESDQTCCINELPEDILVIILSNLDVQEAARTSLLCRKWRNLWTFSLNLDFDCTWRKLSANLGIDANTDCRTQKCGVHKFMECVKCVLDIHQGSTLDRLRISFNTMYYCPCVREYMAKWVDFAIVKRVQTLRLELTSTYRSDMRDTGCAFPAWLLSIPQDLPCFDRLTALYLNAVWIPDQGFEYFLSRPLLERLSVRNAGGLTTAKISGEAPKLKHLEIGTSQFCDELKIVEISAPNLTSFKYGWCREPTADMCLIDVPKLSSISLRNSLCEQSIFKFHYDLCLFRMKKLKLDLRYMEHDRCINFPRNFPEFKNLEDLVLKFIVREDENLIFLSSIIGASPCLQKLTLKYKMERVDSKEGDSCTELGGGFIHQCLKVIQFVGWNGVKTDVQLVYFLIDCSPKLEKLVLDLSIPALKETEKVWRSGSYHSLDGNWRDREDALISARQFERKCQKLSSEARLIIGYGNKVH